MPYERRTQKSRGEQWLLLLWTTSLFSGDRENRSSLLPLLKREEKVYERL